MILDKFKLYARKRTFSCPFCFTLLDAHKITIRETAPTVKTSGLSPQHYHLMRQKERELLFINIIKDVSSQDIWFCSIGSGFAGEELLIKDDVKKMTLIEPDNFAANFLRKKFGKDANIIESLYQSYHPKELYDVIYTSGLGSWMMSNPFLGVESDLMKFCQNYLKEDGIFISLIYGGLHEPGYFLDKKYYIENLIASIEKYNLHPLLYGLYGPHNAILVVGKKSSTNIENIKEFAKEIFVEHGRLNYKKVNTLINTYNFIIGSVWNILYMFKKIIIVVKETVQLIRINIKLIK